MSHCDKADFVFQLFSKLQSRTTSDVRSKLIWQAFKHDESEPVKRYDEKFWKTNARPKIRVYQTEWTNKQINTEFTTKVNQHWNEQSKQRKRFFETTTYEDNGRNLKKLSLELTKYRWFTIGLESRYSSTQKPFLLYAQECEQSNR